MPFRLHHSHHRKIDPDMERWSSFKRFHENCKKKHPYPLMCKHFKNASIQSILIGGQEAIQSYIKSLKD